MDPNVLPYTRDDLKAWLLTLPGEEVVFPYLNDTKNCVVARLLTARGYDVGSVGVSQCHIGSTCYELRPDLRDVIVECIFTFPDPRKTDQSSAPLAAADVLQIISKLEAEEKGLLP